MCEQRKHLSCRYKQCATQNPCNIHTCTCKCKYYKYKHLQLQHKHSPFQAPAMQTQCKHLPREYKPFHNVNAIRQHLECKSQQSTFGMQTHTMRKPLLCTSKQCTSSVWLPRAFRGLVGATCPACPGWLWRPGCCMVATCRTTEMFSLDVVGNVLVAYFEWSAAQLLRRLLCGPAVLLPGETPSSLQQRRPGCCCVPEACAREIFCCMLFAVPFLLTSNGQRLKMRPRLLCVPARLLPASVTGSFW